MLSVRSSTRARPLAPIPTPTTCTTRRARGICSAASTRMTAGTGRNCRIRPGGRRYSVEPRARAQGDHRGRQVRALGPLSGHSLRLLWIQGHRGHRNARYRPIGINRNSQLAVLDSVRARAPALHPVDGVRLQCVQCACGALCQRRCVPRVPLQHHRPRDHRELLLGQPRHRGACRRALP